MIVYARTGFTADVQTVIFVPHIFIQRVRAFICAVVREIFFFCWHNGE